MYSINNSNTLWVSATANGGNGTIDTPFGSINEALENADAGSRIILMSGTYRERVTIQQSGTITAPIQIIAQNEDGTVIIEECWYLYDASDIIIKGFTFNEISHQAISVVGACERNSFSFITFKNCGTAPTAPCTFYFGGSSAHCNTIENCRFSISDDAKPADKKMPIAIMLSEGDSDGVSEKNTHVVIRKNHFLNYGTAIVLGTADNFCGHYNHRIEQNTIDKCSTDGILTKCGDTVIVNNMITSCRGSGIVINGGEDFNIKHNRIDKCSVGIYIKGLDSMITNNCFVNSKHHAICCEIADDINSSNTGNTIIEQNSFYSTETDGYEIAIKTTTFCIVSNNIFYVQKQLFAHGVSTLQLIEKNNHLLTEDEFVSAKDDKFSFKYDAETIGWIVNRDEIIVTESDQIPCGHDKNIDNNTENSKKEHYVRSLFIDAENEHDNEIDSMDDDAADTIDGITDYSTWDIE